jgi:hypothetical protein
MRRINLLSGSRSSTIDVKQKRADRFVMTPFSGEVSKIVIDLTRWLEGTGLTSAVSDSTAIALATAGTVVTATYTAPAGFQSNRLTFTANDGRVRKIDIVTEPDPTDYWPLMDYGYYGGWYGAVP